MPGPGPVDAVLFDVFGTVVDWRGSVLAEGLRLSDRIGREVDWASVADDWRRDGYLRPIGEMVGGRRPWTPIATVMREELDRLAKRHGFEDVGVESLDRLSTVWERLGPWPDTAAGLDRLRTRYAIGPLSNGGFGSLTRMARHAGLRWDCVISAELFHTYKPDPRVYEGAAALLDLPPGRVMLVAAHPSDLRAARACGLATAYVPRPLEWGPGGPVEEAGTEFDLTAPDFVALAEALGA
ncbi:MAG TPA: haloacid dehalogenase type II [Acidimicrobiales bacterium]|nr:haloacid dehalogenase type II [Acidimicrobiales bacterium]